MLISCVKLYFKNKRERCYMCRDKKMIILYYILGAFFCRTRREENFGCRGPNVSILHLRNASADPWEVGSQGSSYSVSSNKSQTAGSRGKSGGNARGSYSRGSSIPSLKRHDTSTSATSTSSLKQHRQDSHGQVSRLLY